jgi:hypothetical protein
MAGPDKLKSQGAVLQCHPEPHTLVRRRVFLSCSSKLLVASSRWNRDAGQDVLLARLSEVHDWEEGGRTSSQAAARIFSKEAAEGDRRVLVTRREVRAQGDSWA